jgi:hypothetical protein
MKAYWGSGDIAPRTEIYLCHMNNSEKGHKEANKVKGKVVSVL